MLLIALERSLKQILYRCWFFRGKFVLERFDFSSDFYALDFRFEWSKFLSFSQESAAESNFTTTVIQFTNSKSIPKANSKCAEIGVIFFT